MFPPVRPGPEHMSISTRPDASRAPGSPISEAMNPVWLGNRRLGSRFSRAALARLGDDQLVALVRRGSESAFEAIYDRHHRSLLSFCRHLLGSRSEAEDALQETFISAHRSMTGSDRPIAVKPWLYTIARNRCLTTLSGRREHTSVLPEIETDGLAVEVQRRAELRELLADLRALPTDQRAALLLCDLQALSRDEIGVVLGVDRPGVDALVLRARSSLIGRREARSIPCADIRSQLATLRGGALRRTKLRLHLEQCSDCRDFRERVRRQRASMAAILPVLPSAQLKAGVLAALGLGGGTAAGTGIGAISATSGGAAAAASATSGSAVGGGAGLLGELAATGLAKTLAVTTLAIGASVGGVAVVRHELGPSPAAAPSARVTAPAETPAALSAAGSRSVTALSPAHAMTADASRGAGPKATARWQASGSAPAVQPAASPQSNPSQSPSPKSEPSAGSGEWTGGSSATPAPGVPSGAESDPGICQQVDGAAARGRLTPTQHDEIQAACQTLKLAATEAITRYNTTVAAIHTSGQTAKAQADTTCQRSGPNTDGCRQARDAFMTTASGLQAQLQSAQANEQSAIATALQQFRDAVNVALHG